MSEGLKELKRLAYENACCRCQYYINNKCLNKGECVWKTIEKELEALEIFKNCICGEFELIDNASTDNLFKTPYRLRIYFDEYTYNEWYLRNKEEYDLLKEVFKNE